MKLDLFFIGVFWFVLAHIAVFFQLNGQFKWEWFKQNEFLSEAKRVLKEDGVRNIQ